jgi:hypothetical protein
MSADVMQLHNNWFKRWLGYHSLWKKSRTVWNPTAHINNFTGNLFLMHLGGLNTAQLPKVMAEGMRQIKALKRIEELEFKELSKGLDEAERAELSRMGREASYALEAKRLGIFGKSQLNDILAGIERGVVKKGALSRLDEAAQKAYQFEDNFNRLSFYLTLRNAGKDERTAKGMVDMMLPDYTRPLPKGWRVLRDSGVAPFISWSYYTVPSIIKMAKTRRGRIAALKALALIGAVEYAASGGRVTPLDNLPFVEGDKPDDFKGRRFVIGHDGDKMTTLKMDRIIPYLELQNPINYGVSQFSGILPNLVETFRGRQLYSGRPITYADKSATDKTVDWIKHLVGQYGPLPAPLVSGMGLIDSVVRSKKRRRRDDEIVPRSTIQEALKLLGINTLTYDRSKIKR